MVDYNLDLLFINDPFIHLCIFTVTPSGSREGLKSIGKSKERDRLPERRVREPSKGFWKCSPTGSAIVFMYVHMIKCLLCTKTMKISFLITRWSAITIELDMEWDGFFTCSILKFFYMSMQVVALQDINKRLQEYNTSCKHITVSCNLMLQLSLRISAGFKKRKQPWWKP